MEGIFLTDRGQIRSHNEDSGGIFYNQKGELLAIIADGMGGHQAGDVASGMATSLLRGRWEELVNSGGPQQVESWLANAIVEVNREIFNYGKGKEECHGMGTTIVVAICLKDFATIAHIGDSRCYLFNENGFRQVTEDHSLVNELVRVGQITKNDAEHHPRKNVLLKALGTEEHVKPDIKTIEWEAGNALLLCSDGLSNKLSEEELKAMLEKEPNLGSGGQALVNLANERGGEDNISLAMIRYEQAPEAGDNEC